MAVKTKVEGRRPLPEALFQGFASIDARRTGFFLRILSARVAVSSPCTRGKTKGSDVHEIFYRPTLFSYCAISENTYSEYVIL